MRALVLGASWLGGLLILSSPGPYEIAAVLAVSVISAGGLLSSLHGPIGARLVVALVVVAAARLFAGPVAGAMAALLLGAGALLRVQFRDVVVGLAVFGGLVAMFAAPSRELVGAFFCLGGLTLALRGLVRLALRRLLRRRQSENAASICLDPET